MKNHTKIFLYTTLEMWRSKIVNPLYLIFNKVNGYIEEINGNKYLTLVSTNKNKEKIKKIFNSDNELPLNKTTEIPTITIVVIAVFHKNNEYYPQVFLEECLYKLQIT